MEQELSLNSAAPQRIPKRNGNSLTFLCFCVITYNTSTHLLPTPLSKYSGRGEVNNHHTKQYWKNVKQPKVQFSSFIPIIFVTAELTEESLVKGREAEHVLPSGPAHSASWVNADLGKNLFLGRNSFWGQVSDGWGHSLTPAETKKLEWRTLPWPGASLPGLAEVPPSRRWGKAGGTVLVNLHYLSSIP